MNNDLKIIKKKYGEKMMHLCRELFATILDNSPSVLPQLLLDNFHPSHFLYDDLVKMSYIVFFRNYIYNAYEKHLELTNPTRQTVEDPVTLMHQAGYTLYECKTEEDIQKFKKYYAPGEALCTFSNNRLENCYVFFAVKDNVEILKRSDFTNPKRQDEYGTSVISIQFTRDNSHTLSIKNRYNHTVSNPDATFANNLDNIIPGLTQSFADHYGLEQQNHNCIYFDLHGYVKANDGKFYKYNFELNNTYFCPNNIVINNYQVTEYPHESYLLADYFLIDLVNKKVTSLLPNDSFLNSLGEISKINIVNTDTGKTITITPKEGEDIIIKINKYSQITSYINNNVLVIGSNFLHHNTELNNIELSNVESIGNNFLTHNNTLSKISLPNVLVIADNFLKSSGITEISLPKVKSIGHNFLTSNYAITEIELPEVETIGSVFLGHNWSLKRIYLPKLEKIGSCSLTHISMFASLYAPKLQFIAPNNNRLKLVTMSLTYRQNKDNYIDNYKKIKRRNV